MAKTRVIREEKIEAFFADLKKKNGGKPATLMETDIEFAKEAWDASQEKGLRELAEYRKKKA